jgi:large subunit ribosomal protein L32
MGALPKRKVTRAKRGFRRQHLVLDAPQLVRCPCGEMRRAHRVCLSCGTYKGRQVLAIGSAEKE